jgi:pSer/pThr/pTyr-binding forkhead associated (FHA) protein
MVCIQCRTALTTVKLTTVSIINSEPEVEKQSSGQKINSDKLEFTNTTNNNDRKTVRAENPDLKKTFIRLYHISSGIYFKITEGQTIGRDSEFLHNQLEHLDTISRRQCLLLYRDQKGFFIQDLQSTNGTFINDKRCTPNQEYPIKLNDILKLGDQVFQIKEIIE